MEILKSKINEMFPMSEASMETFLKAWKPVKFAKGSYLVEHGTVCKSIVFLAKGSIRTCFVQDGQEYVGWISLEHTFVYSPSSFFMQMPSRTFIQALENCDGYSLSKEDLDALCAENQEINGFYHRKMMQSIINSERRIESLMIGTAVERYHKLIRHYPEILRRVSMSNIASFIGVSKETLSRIRRIPSFF